MTSFASQSDPDDFCVCIKHFYGVLELVAFGHREKSTWLEVFAECKRTNSLKENLLFQFLPVLAVTEKINSATPIGKLLAFSSLPFLSSLLLPDLLSRS